MDRKIPDYSNLSVFCCVAYAHQVEGKFEPRSLKCIFLDYPQGTKGYRLWVRETNGYKVIVSRDVVFDEYTMPCRSVNAAGTSIRIDQVKRSYDLPFEVETDSNHNHVTDSSQPATIPKYGDE